MEKFEDKFYNVIREAGDFIIEAVSKVDSVDIYSTENTLYERILSDKYEGIYTLYELVEIRKEESTVYVKGVDSVNEEEYDFCLKDLSPEVIIEIADKLAE